MYKLMLGIIALVLSTSVNAITFDYVAPSDIFFNQSELGLGIGMPFGGLLIATEDVLTQELLESAVINATIDNSNVTLNPIGNFSNLQIYAPILQGEVAGYSSSGPVTDNSSLLTLLDAGESLIDPNAQIQGLSFGFEEDWIGVANIDYEIIIGNQYVEFTTQLHFVEILPDNLWVEVTSGERLTSSVVPIPSAVWLFGSGLLGLIGLARRK